MEHSANTTSANSVNQHQSNEEAEQPIGSVQFSTVSLIVGYFTVAAIAIASLLALTAA